MRRERPGSGQESVWDYPRPPRLERTGRRLRIVFGGETIVDTTSAWRVLETSHPPGYYIPPADVRPGRWSRPSAGRSASGRGGPSTTPSGSGTMRRRTPRWAYPDPTPLFAPLAGFVSFYAGPMDRCLVDDEVVTAQPGGFYGGWITQDVVGPFKGGPGTWGW